MTDPEFATFRDLVEAVEKVDGSLGTHKLEMEKRMGRIEKGLILVGVFALFHPSIPLNGASFVAGAIHLVTYI